MVCCEAGYLAGRLFAQWPAWLQPVLYKPAYTPTYGALWGRSVASPATLDSANAVQVIQYLQQRHCLLRFRSPAGLLELYELPGARAIP